MVVPSRVIVAASTLAIPGLCIVVSRGGWFQFSINNRTHSGCGLKESENGTEYKALPGVPSFRGSVTSSTITPVILMSLNSDEGDSRSILAAIVDIGFPTGGAVSRIPSKV